MNPLASLIPQHKKNNLIRWLNSTPPTIRANLAPLQKLVQRTTKGAHSYCTTFGSSRPYHLDDQSVDTISTWEDHHNSYYHHYNSSSSSNSSHGSCCSSNSSEHEPRIQQTVVIISREPSVGSITAAFVTSTSTTTTATEHHKQRKSQQKNKVLMLLQLEQVTTQRILLKDKWRDIQRDLVIEVERRTTSRGSSYRIPLALDRIDQRTRPRRLPLSDSNNYNDYNDRILDDLANFYRRFDACLDELHERNEIMDLEAFKQLVIREVQERAEALDKFRERLKVVHGQLFQKFIVDELIEGGLYHDTLLMGLAARRRVTPNEIWNEEWIEIDEGPNHHHHQDVEEDPRNAIADKPGEGSEWVVCDF